MAEESIRLPLGVTIPRKYAQSPETRESFAEGARDAVAGWSESDFCTLASCLGAEPAKAYRAGYAAVTAARAPRAPRGRD